MRWAGHVARMGEGRNLYSVLIGKSEGVDGRMGLKWTLGRLVGVVDLIHLAQDRDRWRAFVNSVMKPRGSCATELVILLGSLLTTICMLR
jgi:hypothetical protein